MTELKNKHLGEWTLEEVKKYCKSIVECKRDTCPFCINYDECILMDINPSNWDLSEKLRLTESELYICEIVGAKWVSRDKNMDKKVYLWSKKPNLDNFVYLTCGSEYIIATFTANCFPSIRPGELVCVEGEY